MISGAISDSVLKESLRMTIPEGPQKVAVVGAGIAAAFYVPSYVAGDVAPVVTAIAFLIVVALGAAWIRKSGVL